MQTHAPIYRTEQSQSPRVATPFYLQPLYWNIQQTDSLLQINTFIWNEFIYDAINNDITFGHASYAAACIY